MNSQLYIPEKLKVGFQKRNDTYNGNLGYVIYYDQVGTLRKEAGWERWRDKTIDPIEYDNKLTEGFVLNKDVGGVRRSWSWNGRMEKVRVFDPRGFEFEISIPNLLFILTECNAIKGKGLEGEFVYAWSGKELVLVPVVSQEYKSSKKFTKLQAQKIASKDLILGASYLTKQEDTLIYLGRFMWYERKTYDHNTKAEKRYVFVKEEEETEISNFVDYKDVSKLSAVISDIPVENYAGLMDMFSNSKYASKPVKFIVKPIEKLELKSDFLTSYYHSCINDKIGKLNENDMVFTDYTVMVYTESIHDLETRSNKNEIKGFKVRPSCQYTLTEKGELINSHVKSEDLRWHGYGYNNKNNLNYTNEVVMTEEELRSEQWMKCFVLLESGAEIELEKY